MMMSMQTLTDLRLVLPWDPCPADQWQVAQPLPATLPSSTGISSRRYQPVSLRRIAPQLMQAKPLSDQLAGFESWLTNKVQLNRMGHGIASQTWQNVITSVLHYLGFIHKHCAVASPNLVDFLRPELHAIYLQHCLEKNTEYHASRQHAYISDKVISWLSNQPQGGHASLPELVAWLKRAASQIKDSVPIQRKNVEEMSAAGKWVDASQLLTTIMRGKQLAESAANQATVTVDVARDLHDAALACCIFGYLPPPRLSCLRTCTIPSFTGPCMHPDCKAPARCLGNQLVHDAASGRAMSIHLPHHKTAIGRQHARPICFTLPSELADLLQLYLQKGRPKLVSRNKHPYLFLGKSGQSMASKSGSSKLTNIWHGWLARLGCPQISPSLCRHIFVVDRKTTPAMPGPTDEDAAVVMGNSTSQWDHGIYDVSKFETAALHGVDGMSSWRAAHQQRQNAAGQDVAEIATGQAQPSASSLKEGAAPSTAEASTSAASLPDEDEEDLWLSLSESESEACGVSPEASESSVSSEQLSD